MLRGLVEIRVLSKSYHGFFLWAKNRRKFYAGQDAHPNCKLFITHGGLLSTTEAVFLAVPILAIPIFGDQKLNAAQAVSLGYGQSIAFSQINKNNFAETINELLRNPSYRENVKTRSKIMHDRPVKAIDLANYWVEYVVRHNGAPHLRVAGINLPLYKYYMLDVIGASFGGLLLVMYTLLKIYRCTLTRSKKQQTEPKKKLE